MARLGATVDEASEALGITASTLHQWRHIHREFAEALKVPAEMNDAAVERAMIRCALGFDYITEKVVRTRRGPVVRPHLIHLPPSVSAAHFMLRARLPAVYGKRKGERADDGFLKLLAQFNKSEPHEKREARCLHEASYRVVRAMARWKASDSEIAAALGVTPEAFKKMRCTDCGISEALKAGEQDAKCGS